MTPYYEDGLVTIYHGDARDVLWTVEAPLLVTDPPYGVEKAEWDNELPLDILELAAFRSDAAAIMPGVWNLGRMPDRLGPQRYRWTLSAHLTNGMTNGAVGFGNWIPVVLYSRPDVSLYRQDGDARGFAVGTEDKPNHPSPKPLRVMTWIVSRLPVGNVLDPFMGSGTTLVAAKLQGRRAIGIDLEEAYCEEAAQRCSQVIGLSFSEPTAVQATDQLSLPSTDAA